MLAISCRANGKAGSWEKPYAFKMSTKWQKPLTGNPTFPGITLGLGSKASKAAGAETASRRKCNNFSAAVPRLQLLLRFLEVAVLKLRTKTVAGLKLFEQLHD